MSEFAEWLRDKHGRPIDNLDTSEIGFYADQYASFRVQETIQLYNSRSDTLKNNEIHTSVTCRWWASELDEVQSGTYEEMCDWIKSRKET